MTTGVEYPQIPLQYVADVRPSGIDKHTVEGEAPVRLCNYTDVYYQQCITDDIPFMSATATQGEIDRFLLAPGDVVMTKDSETSDDIGIAAIVTEPLKDVVLGYHNTLLRPVPGAIEPRFLFWYLNSAVASDYWERKARGVTRVGLRTEDVAGLPVPAPAMSVQRRVADMLDEETARIDTLIKKNDRVLALLDLRERSLVTHAVTGHLPQATPEGVTEAPGRNGDLGAGRTGRDQSRDAHGLPRPDEASWPTTPARFVLTEVDERGLRDGEEGELLSVSEYRGVVPREGSASQQAASEDVSHYKRCEPGQLVLNKLWAFRGGIGVSPFTGLVSPDYAVFKIHPRMEPRFVHYQTRSAWFVSEMTKKLRGIGSPDASLGRAPRLNTPELGRIDMYTPHFDVQHRVADMLDAERARMDSLRAAVRTQQELLQLRRKALVTAAVTGQIEV